MLTFIVAIRPGLSVHEQVVFAVKKAVVSGRLRAGDEFPSVRALSRELRINPNTAHKVVATLTADGLLEVRPGIGPQQIERRALERQVKIDVNVIPGMPLGNVAERWWEAKTSCNNPGGKVTRILVSSIKMLGGTLRGLCRPRKMDVFLNGMKYPDPSGTGP